MKETDLLNAWLWAKHRTDPQWRRVRLGVLPTKELSRMFSVILRWADAVVIKDGVVNIIEAKLRPKPEPVAQLELYEMLFKNTPEFMQWWTWPIKKILLTTMVDLQMVEFASLHDVQYEVFSIDDVNKVRTELMQPVI